MKKLFIALILVILAVDVCAQTYPPIILEWKVPLAADDIYTLDLDGDGVKEIYLAVYSGTRSHLYCYDDEGYLQYKLWLDKYGIIYKYRHADERFNIFYPADVDRDGDLDVIAGSDIKGTSVNVQRLYFTEREWVVNIDKIELKWEYELGDLITRVIAWDLDKDGVDEIIASSLEGNIYVFDVNKNIKNKYTLPGSVWDIYIADIDLDTRDEIIAASFDGITVIDDNTVKWEYPTGNRVINVHAADVTNDPGLEIIGLDITDEMYILKNDGSLIWSKKMADPSDISAMNLDRYKTDEMLLLEDVTIYELDGEGNIEWEHSLDEPVKKIHISSLAENEWEDIFVSTYKNLYRFRVNPDYVKHREGTGYYSTARDFFMKSRCKDAIKYATKAREIFREIDDFTGIIQCDAILIHCNDTDNDTDKKNRTANELCNKAEEKFDAGDLGDARAMANDALGMFIEISNGRGSMRCGSLLRKINDKYRGEGDNLYNTGEGFYELKKYENATQYAELAKDVYRLVNSTAGIVKCDLLIGRSRDFMEADRYYLDAQGYVASASYGHAVHYGEMARAIYEGLNSSGDVGKCNSFIGKAQKFVKAEEYVGKAEQYLYSKDYDKATNCTETAKALYVELEYMDGRLGCDLLLEKIKKAQNDDLIILLVEALVALIIILPLLALLVRMLIRRRRQPKL